MLKQSRQNLQLPLQKPLPSHRNLRPPHQKHQKHRLPLPKAPQRRQNPDQLDQSHLLLSLRLP